MTEKKSRGLFVTEQTKTNYFIRWIDGRVEKCICTDAVMHVKLVEGLLEQAGYRRSTIEEVRDLFNRRSEDYRKGLLVGGYKDFAKARKSQIGDGAVQSKD